MTEFEPTDVVVNSVDVVEESEASSRPTAKTTKAMRKTKARPNAIDRTPPEYRGGGTERSVPTDDLVMPRRAAHDSQKRLEAGLELQQTGQLIVPAETSLMRGHPQAGQNPNSGPTA